jgi:8-oxo-dGTP pyrophosphatase MutT (NUDIX family)
MPSVQRAGIVIHRNSDDRFLCVKQRASLFWGWPKGGRNPDESPADCALREFREEMGCEAELLDDHPFHRDKSGTAFFRGRLREGAIISIDKRELCDYEWLTEEELRNRSVSNTTKRVLNSGALNKLKI